MSAAPGQTISRKEVTEAWAGSPDAADRWFRIARYEPGLLSTWSESGDDWYATLGPDVARYSSVSSIDDYLALQGLAPDIASQQKESLSPTGAAGVDFMTRYLTDTPTGPDLLKVENEAAALAKIIALRRTEPPLSIGLFGDWGSGKTFFMRKIRQHVDVLANRTREARQRGAPSAYCDNVVHVEFNAWHYIEHNLWASLVTRVFEVLFQSLAARAEVGLDAQSQLYFDAADQAKRNLDAAKTAAAKAEARAIGTGAGIGGASNELLTAIKDLQDNLGKAPGQLDVKELERLFDSLNQTQGRLAEGLGALPAAARRHVLLTVAVAVGLLLIAAVAYQAFGNVAGAAALVLGPLAVIGTFVLKATSAGLKAVQRIIDDEQVKAARTELTATRRQLATAEAEYKRIQDQQSQTIYRFIEERYLSSDYRKQLGIVALIQRDFETLSRRLRGNSSHVGGLPTVDRIVLYIDDLDRCPSDLVIKVLQAVHLLLAFELFVVVVAVDSRWLLRSLEHRYRVEFGAEYEGVDQSGGEWSSTPQDYLEKIFQIPYWVRPMDPAGYKSLIEALVRPTTVAPAAGAGASSGPAAPAAGAEGPRGQAAQPRTNGAAGAGGTSPTAGAVGSTDQQGAESGPVLLVDLQPQDLEITKPEASFLESLDGFIETPRSAKRLVNLYRLLKLSIPTGSLDSELQFPVVQLMLAILVGFPREASMIFAALGETSKTTWWDFVEGWRLRPGTRTGTYSNDVEPAINEPESASWGRLVAAMDELRSDTRLTDLSTYRLWANVVARYSFQAGRKLSVQTT